MSTKQKRGISVWVVIVGAIALGTTAGMVLAVFQHAEGDSMTELDTSAAVETVKLGAPVQTSNEDPMDPDPEALVGLPAFPQAIPRRLSFAPIGPAKMRIAWFSTPVPVTDVIAFYEKAFSEQHRDFVSHRFGPRSGYAAWLERHPELDGGADPGEGTIHMISAVQQADDTMVFVSASEPRRLLDEPNALPPDVALPPGGKAVSFDVGEVADARLSTFVQYRDRTATEVLMYVKKHLAETGWTIGTQVAVDASKVEFSAVRGSSRVSLAVDDLGTSSTVLLSYEGRRAQR